MEHRYSNILTPVKIGKHVLKNRLINSKCIPEGIQGPEAFPAESHINFAAELAKNGAAIVTLAPGNYKACKVKSMFTSPFNMDDRYVSRYYRRMIDRIHAYGSIASGSTMTYFPGDVGISEIRDRSVIPESVLRPGPESIVRRDGSFLPEITKEGIAKMIDSTVAVCKKLQSTGLDMINVYMSYDASILAKSLSPVFNQREDEYGGSLENRARLTLELFRAIKQACGQDFLIEAQISGREFPVGGYTVEDFVKYSKMCEGLVDIFQIRAWTGDMTHASHYTSAKENPTNLRFAEAFKKAGIKSLCAPVGGFQDLDLINTFIGEGKTDLVAMARPFICDPEYGIKLLEGRGEDVVPCIHCDNCHQAFCSVNPKVGLNHVWPDMFDEPKKSKKVAVIGGGPAGMKAAFTAAERGHRVTLFEKNDFLGGQLIHADFMPNKWAIHDLKQYLIRQMTKNNVEIRLGTKATPAIIEAGGFDAVIAACGSAPKESDIAGAGSNRVWAPIDVFGRENELGENVVVVGGAMVAVDTAMYLAQNGHKVTIITRNREAAYDNNSHGAGAFKEMLAAMEKMTIVTNAQATLVEKGTVTYEVKKGGAQGGFFGMPGGPDEMMGGPDEMQGGPGGPGGPGMPAAPVEIETFKLKYDDIVISAGRKALVAECFEFAGITPEFAIAGDANMLSFESLQGGPGGGDTTNDDTAKGTIRHCMYTAYTSALKL